MFTPLELEKIVFGGAFMGGYKKQDVEDVFNELASDYETLYKENIANKDKIAMLEGLVEKYKTMEDALQNALLLAQTSSDAAIRAAQDKAQNIIKEAEDKAVYITREAEENVKNLRQKELDLKQNINVIAAQNISKLRTQIELLSGMLTTDGNAEAGFGSMPAATPVTMDMTQVRAPYVPSEKQTEN